MNTEELKRLALAATPITTELYGDRYFNDDYSRCDLTKEQDEFLTAANPAAILSLIEERDVLLVALKVVLRDYTAVHDVGDVEMQPAIYQARAAITKAESK